MCLCAYVRVCVRARARERERERERDRDRETERQRQTDRQTERDRDRETETERKRERETERGRETETETERDREIDKERRGEGRERQRQRYRRARVYRGDNHECSNPFPQYRPRLLSRGECPGLVPKEWVSPRPASLELSSLLRLVPENVVDDVDDNAEVANLASRPSPDSKVTGVIVVGVCGNADKKRNNTGVVNTNTHTHARTHARTHASTHFLKTVLSEVRLLVVIDLC